jgi:hypothetical protein
MHRQMNRGFVTKIIKGNTQVYLKLPDRTCGHSVNPLRKRPKHHSPPGGSARRDLLAPFPVQAPNGFLYREPFEKFSQRGFPSHLRSLGGAEAVHPHFHPHGCFPVTKFPAKAIRTTTLLSDSNKVISMCRDRHRDSNVLFPRRFKVSAAQKSATARALRIACELNRNQGDDA